MNRRYCLIAYALYFHFHGGKKACREQRNRVRGRENEKILSNRLMIWFFKYNQALRVQVFLSHFAQWHRCWCRYSLLARFGSVHFHYHFIQLSFFFFSSVEICLRVRQTARTHPPHCLIRLSIVFLQLFSLAAILYAYIVCASCQFTHCHVSALFFNKLAC